MNIITARLLALVLSGILVVTGCGAGGSDSPLPGNPPPTGDSPFSGRLIAEGTAQVHTMNLSMAGDWTVRLGSSVYEVITVHRPGNELLVANASFGSPLTVASYDLSNFALSGTFVWPDSEDRDYGRVHGVALSPDGKHLAAVISGVGDPFLEIVDRGTKEVRFSGRLGMAGNQLHWLSDDLLALVANTPDPANNLAGAIVTVSLAELASGSSEINMNLLVKFTPDEWAVDVPGDFTFSHDLSQIAYAWSSDIWVKNLGDDSAPHQLTSGPTGLVGPVFSPDGRYLALVEFQRYSLRHTFVIPNHRSDPIYIRGLSEETEAYLLEASTLVDTMLLWE